MICVMSEGVEEESRLFSERMIHSRGGSKLRVTTGSCVGLRNRSASTTCVCVCVCPIHFGGSPTDQGETCPTLCSVCRGLPFATYFSSFRFYFSAPPAPAVLAYMLIARRVQPSLSLVDNEVGFLFTHEAFQLLRLSTTRYEREKNPLVPRFEPVTWSLDGYVDTTLDHWGTGLRDSFHWLTINVSQEVRASSHLK